MYNSSLMAVFNCVDQLPEVSSSPALVDVLILPNDIQKASVLGIFHNDVNSKTQSRWESNQRINFFHS